MARGLDIDDITHVINVDTPEYPENYMHRIGRTGRAQKEGVSLVLSTKKELEALNAIEELMEMKVTQKDFPPGVEISKELTPEEQPKVKEIYNPHKRPNNEEVGAAFHEKKEKNRKVNLGGKYKREIKKKYKKSKTRGDKTFNLKNKKKRR